MQTLSFPWSEVPGEPVQQCWRWLQLQGNTVTHHSSLHFVQTPGSGLSAGTSQPSRGGRDVCSSRCVGRLSDWVDIWGLWHVCMFCILQTTPCQSDRFSTLSSTLLSNACKNSYEQVVFPPHSCTFWSCLWAPGAWMTCPPEQGLLTESRCDMASPWE